MAATQGLQWGTKVVDSMALTRSIADYTLMDPAQTVTQIVAAVQAFLGAFDAVTDCQILSSEVRIPIALPSGIKGGPVAGSRVEDLGNIRFALTSNPRSWTQRIPALISAAIVNGAIDLTNAAIVALLAVLEGAVLGGTYTSQDFHPLADPNATFLSVQTDRKQLQRMSFRAE